MLEAKELSFGYPKRPGLFSGFHFRLAAGERVGIAAPSGAGKTTLCRILAGYQRPQEGHVLLEGEDLYSIKGYCPVQLIWQHPEQAVNPRLKMRRVLEEGDGVERRVIEGLGIEDAWLDRYPGELSGGEIQRFCIARALGRRTRFLVADEITTMLDVITQSQIWAFLLDEVQRRDIGLVAVTHSAPLMDHVVQRTVRLE